MRKKAALITSLFSLILVSSAYAVELEETPLGVLEVKGALSGYIISGNRVNEEAKKTKLDVSSGLLEISNKGKPVKFVLTGGAYAFPTVGVDLSKTSDYVELFSPLPIAYLELSPFKNFSLNVGRMGTLIGYEAPFTYQNNYLQRGLVWNMQPVFHHGIRLGYTGEKISFKVGLNDSYFSLGVDSFKQDGSSTVKFAPALETNLSLTPIQNLTFSFNLLIPDKEAYPNEASFPSNKRQYNFVISYTKGNFSLGLDQLFVEAPKSKKAQVYDKASAYGVALHSSYNKNPFKISARLEYVRDKDDKYEIDLVGLGNKNRAFSFTLSPEYYKGPLFTRIEFSYLKAKKEFTYNQKDHQTRLGFELGFKF